MDYLMYLTEIKKCTFTELSEREKIVLIKVIKLSYSKRKISSFFKLKRDKFDDDGPYLAGLIKRGLIEKKPGNPLNEGISYDLSTCCLLYIFLNMQNYPSELLLKYQDNILLKTLLFSHFAPHSINDFFAYLSSLLTQYLRICCRTTVNCLNSPNFANDTKESEKKKMLEYELGWHAKILLIRIALLNRNSEITLRGNQEMIQYGLSHTGQHENVVNVLLSNDLRFLTLFKNVKTELDEGYMEITNRSRDHIERS